eukprot:EG_transcript_14749
MLTWLQVSRSWWGRSAFCIVCCPLLLLSLPPNGIPARDVNDIRQGPAVPTLPPPKVTVTAYSVYCAGDDGPHTRLQITWLAQVVTLMRERLPQVKTTAIFYCQRVEQALLANFTENRSLLQRLPGKWYTNFGWTQMNAFLLSMDLWRLVEGDKVLIFQPDVWVCPGAADRLAPFLKYDYVGAPWGRGFDRGCPYNVGNGGLSLRDRRKAVEVLQDPRTPALIEKFRKQHGPNEDLIWCNLLATLGGSIPSPQEAARFSVENDDYGVTAPLGAHDCTYKSTMYKLEAGCPGILARMSEVRRHKSPTAWAIQQWTLPVWMLWDRLFFLWVYRFTVLGVVAFSFAVYFIHWNVFASKGAE